MINAWQYLRQKRIVLVFLLFVLAFALLFLRLSNVQVINSQFYGFQAAQQYKKTVSLEVVAEGRPVPLNRGNFLDRRGKPLLGSKIEERVVVFPQFSEDLTETSFILGQIFNKFTLDVQNQLQNGPALLPYPVTSQQKKEILKANLKGVIFAPVFFRYGSRPLAVNLIGHLENKFSSAGTGLEVKFDQYLKSQQSESSITAYVNAKGGLIPGLGYESVNTTDPNRRHVVLTIDQRIQKIVEDEMDKSVEEGAVVVMDTSTGDILASATRPTFDPVNLNLEEYQEKYGTGVNVYSDRTIKFSSPGSVFKILVAAAAIEEGIASPDSVFECHDEPVYFKDCDHGRLTLSKALAQSCNNTFARLGLKLGKEKLLLYAKKFNLDSQNIIGYGNFEGASFINDLMKEQHTLVNASIGQGKVELSPIQVSTMLNTIVNGGIYRRPRLVQRLVNSDDKVIKTFTPSAGEQVISLDTALKVQRMLREVTLFGTGIDAYIEGYGTAGKTGTAQVSSIVDGKVHRFNHSWFTGYSPSANPQFIVTVVIEKGKEKNIKATEVYRKIAKRILEIEIK